jgi:hypothetical protein
VAEISRCEVEEVRASGVRVVGDPDSLVLDPGDRPEQLPPDPSHVPIGVAVDVLAAVFSGADRSTRSKHVRGSRSQRAERVDPLATTSSRQLLGEVMRRPWRRLRPGRRNGTGAG